MLFNSNTANYDRWNRAYHSLLQAGNKLSTDDSRMIDLETFKSVYPMYCFDLENQPEELWTPSTTQKLVVHWDSSAVLPYYMIILLVGERSISYSLINGNLSVKI